LHASHTNVSKAVGVPQRAHRATEAGQRLEAAAAQQVARPPPATDAALGEEEVGERRDVGL
jgi:hypothetical protein